jgi:DNA repair protein RadC
MNDDQIIQKALTILSQRLCNGKPLTSPTDTKDYLKLKLAPHDREVFAVIFLTNQHQVIAYEEMFQGTLDGASVHPREVVRRAMHHNAGAVIFAHNHPSGVAEPSSADVRITTKLQDALGYVETRVLDHLVVSCGDVTSMAEQGLV